MLFKFITNYRLCTVSYIECKVRDVKQRDGYLNQVLDPIIDLRETKHLFPILIISLIILYYDLIVLNNIKFVKGFLKNLEKKII